MRRIFLGCLLGAAVTTQCLAAGNLLEPSCDPHGDLKTADWRGRCNAAIDAQTDDKKRAALLFGRAYAAVEDYRYDDALRDLDAALVADPDNPRYLHERAYVNGELSNHAAAIADLDKQIAQQPNEPEGFSERAYARHYAGDLAGAYSDRARIVELDPESLDALAARAEAAVWIGKIAEAIADAKAILVHPAAKDDEKLLARAQQLLDAANLMSAPGEPARCKMRNMETKDARRQITDCTHAFFAATSPHAKAEALTYRSVGWQLIPNEDRATDDDAVAVGIEPGNDELLVNLGFHYLSSNHSWAAERMFSRAIAIKRSPMALAGHARALWNLNQAEAAFTEARESFGVDGNEAATWLLADMTFDRGDRTVAKQLYLSIYRRGSRDDGLVARLKELGVSDPGKAIAIGDKTKQ